MLFGIVGCGRIAQRHAQLISERGRLVAVSDIDFVKANRLARAYDAVAYSDFDQMILRHPEIDLIAVCTPNGLHAEHSILALKNGFHVLCEKPMALNTEDCRNMIRSAEVSGRQLFIVKQNRFNPPVLALKKALDNKILGKILSVQLNCFWNRNADYYTDSWRGTMTLDGGTLFTQFSHFIDILYWTIGDVKNIKAFRSNSLHQQTIEFEDTGVVILEFDTGVIGTINYTVNCFSKNMEGSLTVFGEKGTVKIGGQYLNTIEYQDINDYAIPNPPSGKVQNDYGFYQGSMSNHDKVYDNLIDVLLNQGQKIINPADGMKTVEIINRIYSSAPGIINDRVRLY